MTLSESIRSPIDPGRTTLVFNNVRNTWSLTLAVSAKVVDRPFWRFVRIEYLEIRGGRDSLLVYDCPERSILFERVVYPAGAITSQRLPGKSGGRVFSTRRDSVVRPSQRCSETSF
jgi:hypothetical protein